MATTITNQARLQFTYGTTTGTASSNIASTVVQGPLTADKSVLEDTYRAGDELTYMINVTNNGPTALTAVTVIDDLGAYEVTPTLSRMPLRYKDPTHLYINGVFSSTLTPVQTDDGVTFTIPSLAAGANAMLIYKAQISDAALLEAGAEIVNTATITATGVSEPLTVSETVDVEAYADVSIIKAMSPNPVTDGGTLTYTFTIQNYGNTEATDVVFSDSFTPSPDPITVMVAGTTVAPANYSYTGGLLTLPATGSPYSLTIPAATFTQDTTTGEVAVNPGIVSIVVTGTL